MSIIHKDFSNTIPQNDIRLFIKIKLSFLIHEYEDRGWRTATFKSL